MKKQIIYILLLIGTSLCSCRKYLDKVPDIKLGVPTSLSDFQKLLDKPELIDNSTPGILDLGCDDYYLLFQNYQSLATTQRNCYTWATDTWETLSSLDWNYPYANIYYCNVVLEGLSKFKSNNYEEQNEKNIIQGHALFIRAIMHHWLEETFGQPYTPTSANTDMGIPLRLNANLNNVSTRPSVQDVYAQIIDDLKAAILLLPTVTNTKSRPSKAAANAFLARVYLTMQDYSNAASHADSALQINNILFDYNNLTVGEISSVNPFSRFASPNDFGFEVLYQSYQLQYNVIRTPVAKIDSNLYNSYDGNDLRKTVFFRSIDGGNTFYFKGYYSGVNFRTFTGPSIDELYLIRAECFARKGDKISALKDLNALLSKRYKSPFVPVDAIDANSALLKILNERRKELIFRGLRWIDLRRLNQDPKFAKTLSRNLNGQTYNIQPNDSKYTYSIPNDEIHLSGIQQNPR